MLSVHLRVLYVNVGFDQGEMLWDKSSSAAVLLWELA